jgi:anthranilate phosphoribosyltransferase
MRELLEKLTLHQGLSRGEARAALENTTAGSYSEPEIAAFVTTYLMGDIRPYELAGFRDALLELCIPVDLGGIDAIDMCGTGGDGKNTFNISTTASFVVAGAGYSVCKHGNYGVSSACGSSNVLEALGYVFAKEADAIREEVNKFGISFIHAPFFHPALKSVAGVRRALGVKTFFNMLGPLVNPARPTHQIVGVFSLSLLRLYRYLLEEQTTQFCVVHSLDGYDEISLTAPAKVVDRNGEYILYPKHFGLVPVSPEALFGGADVESSKDILLKVLDAHGSPEQEGAVLANAALAIKCFNPAEAIEACYAEAHDSLHGGHAASILKSIVEHSKKRSA